MNATGVVHFRTSVTLTLTLTLTLYEGLESGLGLG